MPRPTPGAFKSGLPMQPPWKYHRRIFERQYNFPHHLIPFAKFLSQHTQFRHTEDKNGENKNGEKTWNLELQDTHEDDYPVIIWRVRQSTKDCYGLSIKDAEFLSFLSVKNLSICPSVYRHIYPSNRRGTFTPDPSSNQKLPHCVQIVSPTMHLRKVYSSKWPSFHLVQTPLTSSPQPAIFLSILLAAPNTSLFIHALPAAAGPILSSRIDLSSALIVNYKALACVVQTVKNVFITQNACIELDDFPNSVIPITAVAGYMSALTVGLNGLTLNAECTVKWYQGLLCLGNPIGTSPTVASGSQPSSCLPFTPGVPSIPPTDPSNPYGILGAYSVKMTCI